MSLYMEWADDSLVGAPGMEELSLMLRGFLIKLTSLDGQLEDIKGELIASLVEVEADQ